MKTYINNKGEKQHFIGAIPAGWREMTANELQQEEQAKQLMTAIKTELSAIYEAVPSLLLKAQYKPIKAEVEAFIEAGELENAEQLLLEAKETLDEPVKAIATAIYNKYKDLTNG